MPTSGRLRTPGLRGRGPGLWAGQGGTRGERRGLWEGSRRDCEVGSEAEEACGRGKAASGRGFRDGGGGGRRPHLVHKALGVEQCGPRDGVHLQRVASVGEQELRAG